MMSSELEAIASRQSVRSLREVTESSMERIVSDLDREYAATVEEGGKCM
jgi:hypothetical protein